MFVWGDVEDVVGDDIGEDTAGAGLEGDTLWLLLWLLLWGLSSDGGGRREP